MEKRTKKKKWKRSKMGGEWGVKKRLSLRESRDNNKPNLPMVGGGGKENGTPNKGVVSTCKGKKKKVAEQRKIHFRNGRCWVEKRAMEKSGENARQTRGGGTQMSAEQEQDKKCKNRSHLRKSPTEGGKKKRGEEPNIGQRIRGEGGVKGQEG